MKKFYVSEAVSAGHPDKVADQISDAILDLILAEDPHAKVAVETLVTGRTVILSGEVRTSAEIGSGLLERVVKQTIADIGYTSLRDPFNAFDVEVHNLIQKQSTNLATINSGEEVVAGDQGMMYGYATKESPDRLPIQLSIAKQVVLVLEDLRRHDPSFNITLGPDAKSLVTVSTEDNGKTFVLERIVVSTQHRCALPVLINLKPYIKDAIVSRLKSVYAGFPVDLSNFIQCDDLFRLNEAGEFIEGGPSADTGLTGRKIIVDTYGGMAPHGGGAFSGKDPSKVDRSGALLARHIAKKLVDLNMCDKCLVSISYEIGQKIPNHIEICSFGTAHQSAEGVDSDEMLKDYVLNTFNLEINDFINDFQLKKPIYRLQAKYGLNYLGALSSDLHNFYQRLDGQYINISPFSWEGNEKVVG